MCSNHTGQPIDARIRIYGAAGTLYANVSFTIEPNATYTAVTRPIPAYQANRNLGLGAVSQGMGVVQSSHEGLVCSAQVVDAEALPPTFMSGLNMERFER